MKKYLLSIATVALSVAAANAQALFGYTYSATTQAYAPLGDEATVLYTAPTGADDALYSDAFASSFLPAPADDATTVEGIELGFSFPYCGTTMTHFAVSGGGYVMVNDSKDIPFDTTAKSNWNSKGSGNWFGVGSLRGQGTCYASDTQQPTVVKYAFQGEAGARKLVVEWQNAGFAKDFSGNYYQISYQVILHESGDIDIAFESFANVPEDVTTVQLRTVVKHGTDYICTTGTDLATATFDINSQSGIKVTSATAGNIVQHIGYPAACQVPATQPTDLAIEASTTTVTGSFTATADADNYLVVYATEAISAQPQAGTVYAAGDKLGNATVVCYGTATSFSFDAEASTSYNVAVYAVNAYGLEGPVYNTTNPPTAAVVSKPAPVTAFSVVASDLSSITVDVDAPEGLNVVIAYTPFVRNATGAVGTGLFNEFTGSYSVGDKLPVVEGYTHFGSAVYPDFVEADHGGIVAYVGPAAKGIVIKDLAPSTGYYLAAATYNSDLTYTSEVASATAATYLQAPYSGIFAEVPFLSLPQGWQASTTVTSTSDDVPNSYAMAVAKFFSSKITQGSQVLQLEAKVTKGFSATKGLEVWAQPQPVVVGEANTVATFTYGINHYASRFSSGPYNDWAEGDVMAVRVSDDGGATWTDAKTYTADNHATQESATVYTTISADLTA